jgi:UTP:GlnB (protein PII) uridylyltransferase
MIGGNLSEKLCMKNLRNNITDVVQSKAIRGGSLETIVPELYALRECIEINPWHDHQSVFDHTTSVLAAFEEFLDELSFSSKQHDVRLMEYLSSHVYGISHSDLIRLGILFHDIAKPISFETDAQNGMTNCPHHEVHSALSTIEMANAFGLPKGTCRTIAQLALMHMSANTVVNTAMNGEPERVFGAFQETVADLYIPLLLLAKCDASGSDFPLLDLMQFEKRDACIDAAIHSFSLALE